MIRFILRLAGMIALSIATIMAVLDLQRSIAASMMVLTPLGDSWEFAFPGLATGDAATTGSASWIGAMYGFAGIPGFLVFAMLAIVLLTIGGRRQRPATI